jgi:hypothetical protein
METIKRTITTVIFCAVLLLASINTVAQQNTVSIAASGAVVLTFVKPVNAGDPVLQVTDDNNWLNYNLTATSGKKYSIMVQLESTLPEGLQLEMVAGAFQGTWGGNVNAPNRRGTNYTDDAAGDSPGTPATPVKLSLLPQVLVGSIGTFDTGTGAYVGHKLTYTMSISDYSTVMASSSNVNVLYTISELP